MNTLNTRIYSKVHSPKTGVHVHTDPYKTVQRDMSLNLIYNHFVRRKHVGKYVLIIGYNSKTKYSLLYLLLFLPQRSNGDRLQRNRY